IAGVIDLKAAKLYDTGHPSASVTAEGRTAATKAPDGSVSVVGPDNTIPLTLTYPMSTARTFDEVLRLLDSMAPAAKQQVPTPVNWKQGDDVIILTSVSDEDAKKKYPSGWKTLKPYLRVVSQPK